MNVLVLGGGGREHALVWRLACGSGAPRIFCAPGNAGTSHLASNVTLDPADPALVLAFVEQHDIGLTVVGPELPLTRGVVDSLRGAGRAVFGPTRAAAEIESSKVFAKEFMRRHRVPTADCAICSSAEEARRVVESGRFSFPLVLKADGLAAGKGVIIADDRQAAISAIEAMMVARQFGQAGERVLVEELLEGPELSFFVVSDGARALAFSSAQDHKRAYDGDSGPNTGGMGAFAPSPLVDDAMADRITREVIVPTVEGMRAEGRPFTGFLYAGLMLTADGPKVLEFNARLGDPEAQVLLPLLGEDLLPLLHEAATGRLDRTAIRFSGGTTVGVVVASAGYPDRYETGKPIEGLSAGSDVGERGASADVLVFHAGTARRDRHVVTAGGRVLTVVGRGTGYAAAMSRAYEEVARISFAGMHYRKDIGAKAVRR